jgi:signal transduction histidine kinase/ligand-binding sensor domain-containing protein
MRKLFSAAFSIVCFLQFVNISRAEMPHTHSGKYVPTDWGLKEGLPQSSVNHIIQSRDGYLWLATFGGLVRFNGESFTTFNRSNSKGLRSDRMLTLHEDRSGAIWCSTEDGFSRFRNGTFQTFQIIDSIYNYAPLMITEDGRGRVWITANAKPYRFENDSFVHVPVFDNARLVSSAIQNPGGTWLVHNNDLLRSFGDSVVLIKKFSGMVQNKFEHVVEDPTQPGLLWIATSGSGVLRYDAYSGHVRQYTPAHGLPSPYVRRLYFNRSNMVMTSGFNGISVFNGTRFVPLRTVGGVGDHEYNEVIQDAESNYWVGSPSRGVRRLRPAVITTIGDKEGLREGKMLSLVRLKNGTFLFGTNCGGIYEYTNGRAVYSAINASLVNLCVWSIFEDSKKRLWIGSRVLMRYDSLKGKGTLLKSSQGFNGEDIFAINEDSKGNIWIGCVNGLFLFDGKQYRQYTKANGLTQNDVRSLYEDAAGTMWIGTSNGLHKFENGKLTPVPITLDGDSTAEPLSSYVRAIYQDSEGTYWFGTYGGGIIRLREGKFSAITTQQGLADNIVSHIYECRQGYFWMGSNRGIVRVKKTDLNDVADGTIDRLHSYMYGTNDGMFSPETNGGFQPSIALDDEGNVYFPTVAGVAVVATEQVSENKVVPPVKIEKVLRRDRDIGLPEAIVLPYDSTDIEIHYAALSYVDPAKHQYKFMIAGVDPQWNRVGNRTTAYYTNIPAGEWTFHVLGSNNDGVWNETGASIAITILPPFWHTWWFYSLVVLCFVVAGPTVYYYRVTQLKKEKERQQMFAERLIDSQEQERRRIALELHDGLGQQILIMKNRAELALKNVTDPGATADQLREIAGAAVSSINDVRAISHGLRPVHLEQFGLTETVKNLFEQLVQTSAMEWISHVDDIDDIIPKEKQINFYRILQEGTNNILRHSSATQASIMIRRSDSEVILSIWDNGKGFDPGKKISGPGMGLSGIWERAHTLGGTNDVKTAPGEGTTIKIIIPIDHHG